MDGGREGGRRTTKKSEKMTVKVRATEILLPSTCHQCGSDRLLQKSSKKVKNK